jgi:ribulose 1,5-bisphosphate synthetase/thiazole synthase
MELDEIGVSRAIFERFARMGPVFGGLLLSGEKVARLLLDRLGSRR